MARFCEQCGSAIEPNTKFCQTCGKPAPVTESAAAPASVVPPHPMTVIDAPAPDYNRMKKLYNQAAQVDPVQRDEFLRSMCGDDITMLQQLRGMFATEPAPVYAQPVQSQPVQTILDTTPPASSQSQVYFIGPYRMLRELGRGGMGVVYLAVRDDGAFRKNVALKLLLRECVTAEFISRFKQERQVLAALDHPNIARILDGGDTTEGMPYYVMEYVEGLALDRYCDQQRLSLTARIKLFQQVCLAVDYLHQNSILHRDLKPSNILVSSDGTVKLLDFGIAKVVGAGSYANPDLTTAQGRPMTPTYASPEQLSGATLQKTSDLYSLGAILYGLLTGRSAYNDLDDKLAKVASRELPTKPSTNIREDLRSSETTAKFRRAMMGELDSIVLMTMQIDPKDRYQSAGDLAKDLQHFLDGTPVTAYHTSAAHRGVKLLQRKRAMIAVLCAFLLLGALGIWQWVRLDRQKAESARLNQVIEQLESRLNNPASVDAKADISQLQEAFKKDFKAAADHDRVLARGVNYLDRVSALNSSDPKLSAKVGDAYQQLGTLQEENLPPAKANTTALATFKKAATKLAVSDSEQSKKQLAEVNSHIHDLGGNEVAGTAPPPPPQQEPPPQQQPEVHVAQAVPVTRSPVRPVIADQPELHQTAPPPPPGNKPLAGVSSETEDRLASVTAKVQIADQTLEPTRRNLERDGQTLSSDTLTRIARMHSSLERAQRAVTAGNEADAKESLATAEALADKLLHTMGR